MKTRSILIWLSIFLWSSVGHAQESLHESNLWMLSVEGAATIPGGDLSNRFGLFGKTGGGLYYRFGKQWYLGSSAHFLFNSNVKEESPLKDISTPDGRIIGADGLLYLPELQMRGWQGTFWLGKLTEKVKGSGSGLLTLFGVGFLQHRINYFLSEHGTLPQITGDYVKGYDRLSNGFALSEYIAYHYLSANHLVNFNVGLEMSQAFTRNRREFDYALGQYQRDARLDLVFALKASWILPFYKRKRIQFPGEPSFK